MVTLTKSRSSAIALVQRAIIVAAAKYRPILPPQLISLFITGSQVTIALVPPSVEAAIGDGVFDGAVRFVCVRAVGKAAETDVGTDVAIKSGDFFGDDVPQAKLADARRIDDEATDFQRNQ